MSKGDQSVPVPDLPSFFGNAKESARQAEKELKQLQATMRQAVREGKQLEPQLIRRVNELEGIKQRAAVAGKQVREIKELEKSAKLMRGIATAQRIKELLSGNQGVAAIAGQIVTDPQVLEKASRVLAKSMPKFAGALGRVAPYAGIAGVAAQAAVGLFEENIRTDQSLADRRNKNFDVARAMELDPRIRKNAEDVAREILLSEFHGGDRNAVLNDPVFRAALELRVSEAVTERLDRIKALSGSKRAMEMLLGSDLQTMMDRGVDPVRLARTVFEHGGKQAEQTLDEALKLDHMDADAQRKQAFQSPVARWKRREAERQADIAFQRRRDRIPAVTLE